jgi:TRAP-type C4-dicarboxylate transport system permease small subunit
MAAAALFMFVYGWHLCIVTWPNTIAEFPWLSVGITYLPIPIAGALTTLFLIEKVWLGDPPKSDVMYSDQAAELE